MKDFTVQKIAKLQREYEYSDLQSLINSGMAWKLEGSVGRAAIDALKSGACMLPTVRYTDYYGNVIPSRYDIKKGTTGSYQNCVEFWSRFSISEIEL
jgi:hypothetical protein